MERGTVTILAVRAASGRPRWASSLCKEAAGRGERPVVYTFEESTETLLRSSEAINITVGTMIARGTLAVVPVEPLRLALNEFATCVRQEIEKRHAQIVIIDSMAGYRLPMRGENLVTHLHALYRYLQNMGITMLLINEGESISSDFRATEIGISYLTDNIVFTRFWERALDGRVELRDRS